MDERRTKSLLHRPDGAPVRVLVVDDEPDVTDVLAGVLTGEGFQVRTAADGAGALATARDFRPDAVVLDWMLPDLDGLQVLRELRREAPSVCVLFLTARDAVEDRIAGITAGGDDYVTKPFSLEEVLARLRGLLRRAGMATEPGENRLTVGDLTMDEEAREVRRAGTVVDLSRTEFELLRFLMRNPAGCCPRTRSSTGSGPTTSAAAPTSSIDAGRTPMIHTVRGVGYVLKPEPS